MQFALDEDQIAVRDMARVFTAAKIAPHALRWDEDKHLPVDVMREAAALGIGGIYIRDDVGGSALYLLDSVSLNQDFTAPTKIPEGFVETAIAIPHPPAGAQPATLYLRLRDDPATEETATLSVQTDTPVPPPVRGRGSRAASGPPPATAPVVGPPSATVQPQSAAPAATTVVAQPASTSQGAPSMQPASNPPPPR